MIGIYKIISPTNKVYVGQSINIEKRFLRYKSLQDVRHQRRLLNSFNKHGATNHTYHILEICDIRELNNRERFWQDYYNVIGKEGLNCMLQKSSDYSGKMSGITKKRISESKKGCTPWNKGVKQSYKNGKVKKVKDINTGVVYSSITKASKVLGIKRTTLNAMLSNQNRNTTSLTYI